MSTLLAEVETEFSRIRVKERGRVREMIFLRADGQEVTETALDLDAPHRLLLPYYRWMFTSLVLRPQQDRILLLGLGGGTMVRFLRRERPKAIVDVVEVDPKVVDLAAEYFDTRPSAEIRIWIGDGAKHLRETPERYDAVYVDAYLRPGPATDDSGAPLHLRSRSFCANLVRVLREDGLAAFNLIRKGDAVDTLDVIGSLFPHVYRFPVPTRLNLVAVASRSPVPYSEERLREAAEFARGLE